MNLELPSQFETPLLTTLINSSKAKNVAFYTPGHKKGQGIEERLKYLLGKKLFQADLPELPELDNLFAPQDAIARSQDLAAECFGAAFSWFLVNGSTCGIVSAIIATCKAGDKIILPRNIHQSAIAGLIFTGAIPVFINPEYDTLSKITYSITAKNLQDTLKQHPETKAVMVLHPSYQGICGDLKAIVNITKQYNIPLLVDEAHGGHFAFHEQLPPSALSVGADLTVQSTHKVLGAMTQASMLHLQGKIAPQRISKALQLMQSTSPSYILLASLDAARKQMALEGRELMSKALKLADRAREAISEIPKLSVLELTVRSGFKYLDRTRLTVDITQLGITGYEADEILHQQLGITCELPLLHHLTFIITFGNTEEDIEKLIQALTILASDYSKQIQPVIANSFVLPPASLKISPREAYFAATETVPLSAANDRICGELICPYPPGIPILMPGEVITREAIDYLQQVLKSGGVITGCSDETLKTIMVIDNS